MSGGYIRNAALHAAFLAAEEGTATMNVHLEHALQRGSSTAAWQDRRAARAMATTAGVIALSDRATAGLDRAVRASEGGRT